MLTFDGAPGPGRTAIDRAMHELFAIEQASLGVRFAGGTDRAIARALLRRAGLADDTESIGRVLDVYLRHLAAVLSERRYRPIGAVAEAVAACKARGAVVGVATGNVRAGAQIKLSSAGLGAVFDLDRGGFGCDAEARPDILRVAIERACGAASAASARASDVVVVGDTEHDVRAARAVGARVVGVATTAEARAELEAAGADAIVGECGDDLVRAIG